MDELSMNEKVTAFQTAVAKAFAERIGHAPIIIIAGNPDTGALSLVSNYEKKTDVEAVLMELLKTAKAEDVKEEFAEAITEKLEEPPENGQEQD